MGHESPKAQDSGFESVEIKDRNGAACWSTR
jgi:hypothetical protein